MQNGIAFHFTYSYEVKYEDSEWPEAPDAQGILSCNKPTGKKHIDHCGKKWRQRNNIKAVTLPAIWLKAIGTNNGLLETNEKFSVQASITSLALTKSSIIVQITCHEVDSRIPNSAKYTTAPYASPESPP